MVALLNRISAQIELGQDALAVIHAGNPNN